MGLELSYRRLRARRIRRDVLRVAVGQLEENIRRTAGPFAAFSQKLAWERQQKGKEVLCRSNMEIGGKIRRIEEREDGLWYLAHPEDQADRHQGEAYIVWYENLIYKGPSAKVDHVYS